MIKASLTFRLPVCLGIIGIIVFLWMTSPKHLVSREHFAHIQAGMTRQEITTLLGPPGDYREDPFRFPWTSWTTSSWGELTAAGDIWFVNLGTINVCFGFDETATGAAFFEPRELPHVPSAFDHVDEWLRLLWGESNVKVRE
jgi:hypothetical protein